MTDTNTYMNVKSGSRFPTAYTASVEPDGIFPKVVNTWTTTSARDLLLYDPRNRRLHSMKDVEIDILEKENEFLREDNKRLEEALNERNKNDSHLGMRTRDEVEEELKNYQGSTRNIAVILELRWVLGME